EGALVPAGSPQRDRLRHPAAAAVCRAAGHGAACPGARGAAGRRQLRPSVGSASALPQVVMPNLENPLIVQADKSILLEVHNPRYEEARDVLARFAELEKSPDHLHTYRITPLSLWNAAS